MNSIVVGRIVLFLIVVGIAFAVINYTHGCGSSGFKMPSISGLPSLPSMGGGSSSSTGTKISILTTPSKSGWLQDEVEAFNKQNAGTYTVTLSYEESRQGMQDIINNKLKPDLWSPSSPIWIDRLSEYSKQQTGNAWIDPDDSSSCRVFLKSPMVILTTSEKRAYISKLFTSPNAWTTLSFRPRAPWGRIRYSHANPLVANSGMLTLALMLNEYSQQHDSSQSLDNIAGSPGFIGFMSDVDRSLDYDQAARSGSQPLVDGYVDSTASRDFIMAYESSALAAASNDSDLCVVYPNPTIVADQMVGVMKGPWMSEQEKQGAQAFLTFLGSNDSMNDAIGHDMRPSSTQSSASLSSTLDQHSSQGFHETYSAIEIPPYNALNDAAFQWSKHVAPQHQE